MGLADHPNVGCSSGVVMAPGVGAPHGSEDGGGGERIGVVEMGEVAMSSGLGVSPHVEPDAHGSSISTSYNRVWVDGVQ